MKTAIIKKEDVKRRWYLVDAKDKVLGRLSTRVATILRGKHKPDYTPHVDSGDFVVVINAAQVKLTGNKENDKMYYHHTEWAGHIRGANAATVRKRKPETLVKLAVRGMLPKGGLGRAMFSKLKVYAGGEHPHTAQKPEVLSL